MYDSKVLMDTLGKGPLEMIKEVEMIQRDIWAYTNQIPTLLFQLTRRTTNQLANLIAKQASRGLMTPSWVVTPTGKILEVLHIEAREGMG
ncbi:unnamed protein product [Ilex paraguariensis]|uniref:RNase H type-1 domain-containing protein n=1 Tax=Ilex paraguariensis TaxID=185542 RepID=A0ABC8SVH0_9AQUA